jgi:hypothetical protein
MCRARNFKDCNATERACGPTKIWRGQFVTCRIRVSH